MSSRTIEVVLPYDSANALNPYNPMTVVLGGVVVPPSVTGGNPPVGSAYVTLFDPTIAGGGGSGTVGTTTIGGVSGLNVNLIDNATRQVGLVGLQDSDIRLELGRIRWLLQIIANEFNPDNALDLSQLNPETEGV